MYTIQMANEMHYRKEIGNASISRRLNESEKVLHRYALSYHAWC